MTRHLRQGTIALAAALLLATVAAVSPAEAQARLALAGFAGGAFDAEDSGPTGGGGGFAWQAEMGVQLSRIVVGGEVARHDTGRSRHARVFGGFFRFLSPGDRPIRPYLVAGIGAYRFTPSQGETTTVGGSIGPGATWRFLGGRAMAVFEARFHSPFDRVPGVASQQFVSVLAGLQLGL
jgi:hypothetical protein